MVQVINHLQQQVLDTVSGNDSALDYADATSSQLSVRVDGNSAADLDVDVSKEFFVQSAFDTPHWKYSSIQKRLYW